MKVTAVEFLIEELNNIKSSSTDQYGKITFLEKEFIRVLEQAKEMENDYKLKNQLFKGKVMDIIGWDKTLELLKECENAFKNK